MSSRKHKSRKRTRSRSPSSRQNSISSHDAQSESSPPKRRRDLEEDTLQRILHSIESLSGRLDSLESRSNQLESATNTDIDALSLMADDTPSLMEINVPLTTNKSLETSSSPIRAPIEPIEAPIEPIEAPVEPVKAPKDSSKTADEAASLDHGLFDPVAQSTSWKPSSSFSKFLESNFRRKLTYQQSLVILEDWATPEVDSLSAPKLDQQLLNQVPSKLKRGQRQTGQGRGGRRAPQKQRTCEDCEENVGTQFCADCQPPLVLCDDCAVVLHRGATRRNHQLKDVSEAPAPARNKGYTPKAYRAPFAMLVAFHRAANEVPSKMSLTADELKPRAQPLTNTDLEIKQGRWFGGFDSLENALVKNELVQKEARTPKYSLLAKGQPLAARCSEFDYAVQNLTQAASVPTIPFMGARPVLRNRQVCLLVDSEEPLRERFVRVARQRGLSAKTRKLPVGDFLWVLLPPGVNPDTVRDMPDQELVLPMIVERKTWDDLWSSLKTTRFANQVQRMKRCGLQNLFYLVEGSPKELKGNPGPEVETYLQDKIDSLLIDDQFLVNRTGSWLKTVEWLCHLTNMSIESRQSEGETSLMTYSEFSHSGKLKKLNRTILAAPVTSTVWSATEFIDALRSHSRGGNELHNLPVSRGEERSLIVIQGLTLYNKQCHKLLDKALADLLENTHQTAEACVQRHLHGVTDQLVHEDVSQWYILWLQVFKGVMVRRTESEEESAQVLCKFYQNTPGGVDAPPFNDGDVGVFIGASEENLQRLPEDDLVFANDSQEEDAMVRQALRTSEYEHKTPLSRDVTHSSIVKKPPSSTATKAPVATSSASRAQNHSIDTMNEREQLELAMELSRVENAAKESCNSTVKTPVKPFASQQHRAVSRTPVMPRTNMEVPKSTHTRTESPDDEFQEALQLSLEEFERAKPRQNHRADMAGTDHHLQRALELSKMEYEQFREDTVNHGKSGGVLVDRDTELEEVLELSKLECETKNLEQHQGNATLELREAEVEQLRDKKRNLMITSQDQKGKDVDFSGDSDLQKALELSKVEYKQHVALDNKDVSKRRDSSNEDDLTKALLSSRLDCTQLKEDALGMAKEKLPTCNVDQAIDGEMANALELSKMECSGVHSCDANRERSRDGDLERALELSRIEYTQSTNSGPLDEKDKAPDVIVLEESRGLLPSRDQDLSHLNESALSVDDDGYVPSSVPSDHGWDPESENQDNDVFDALNPVGITGNSKDSAILLDSQEPIDDTDHGWDRESDSLHDDVFGASHPVTITGKSKGSAILLDSQEPIDDTVNDFAYALKVQEELNKETIRGNSSHDDSLNKKHTVGPELNRQLITYREFQKERYGVISGRRDKSSRGLDFRRNVAAIACGKPVQIGVASPISRSGNSEKRGELGRVLGDKPSCSSSISRVDRDKRSPCRDGVHIIRDDGPGLKMVGSPSSSCDKPFVSHPGTTSSPRPFSSSASSFERVHKRPSSTFSGPCSPRSAVASSPVSPSISSSTSTASQSRSSSDKPLGPKCGACGEIGHNKNSKMCPHYFSAEAVQRREEQSRKRKAKKEEEEREFNDRLGALAAQRLSMEEQSRIVGDQLDQLRRQSQNMADTQKKLEDAIKRKRKR